MEPAVNRLLPPLSSSGATSSISTLAPCSCAAKAALNAAFPAPTTITSATLSAISPVPETEPHASMPRDGTSCHDAQDYPGPDEPGGRHAASGLAPISRRPYSAAATTVPPCALDQPPGSRMNASTSASIFGSNLPLSLATASTSHQVASACRVTPRSPRI